MDFLRLHLPGLHQALRGALDSLSTFISYLVGDEVPTAGRREAPAEEGLGEAVAGEQGKIVEEEGQEALEGLGCSQSKGEEELGGPEEPGRCQEGSSAAEQTWGGGEGRSHGSPEDRQDTGVWEVAKASGCQMLSASLEVLQDSEAESEAERDGSSQGQESQVSSEEEMKRGETPSTWEEEEVRPGGPGLPGGVESEWAWHREPEGKGSAAGQRVPGESPESEQAGREVVGEESRVLGAGGAGREVEVRCGQGTGIQGTWQPRAEREDWVISGTWETRTASGEEAGETAGGEEGRAAAEGEETRTTSGEGSAGTTSEEGEAGTTSGEGEAGTTSREGEAEATSGEEEAGSVSGGEEACVISGAEGGWINAGRAELRTPSDREEIWGATGTQEGGTTSGGEETGTTSEGEEDEATSSEEEAGTTSYREEAWTAPGTEETCPDLGGEEAGRTSDLEEACTTSSKEETCIASGMVGAWTASGGEEAGTASGREETCTTSDTEEACTALGREEAWRNVSREEAGTTSAGGRTHPTSCEEEVGFLGVRGRDYGAAPEQGTLEGTGRVRASEGDLGGDQEEVDEKKDAGASQSDKASQPLGIEALEGAQALRAGGEGFGRPSQPSEAGEGVQGPRDSEIIAAGAREKEAVQTKEAEEERESSRAAEPTPAHGPEPSEPEGEAGAEAAPGAQPETPPGERREEEVWADQQMLPETPENQAPELMRVPQAPQAPPEQLQDAEDGEGELWRGLGPRKGETERRPEGHARPEGCVQPDSLRGGVWGDPRTGDLERGCALEDKADAEGGEEEEEEVAGGQALGAEGAGGLGFAPTETPEAGGKGEKAALGYRAEEKGSPAEENQEQGEGQGAGAGPDQLWGEAGASQSRDETVEAEVPLGTDGELGETPSSQDTPVGETLTAQTQEGRTERRGEDPGEGPRGAWGPWGGDGDAEGREEPAGGEGPLDGRGEKGGEGAEVGSPVDEELGGGGGQGAAFEAQGQLREEEWGSPPQKSQARRAPEAEEMTWMVHAEAADPQDLEDAGGREDGGPRQQSEAGPGPQGEAEGCAEEGEAHSCWTEALLPASRLDVSVSRSRALLSRNASQRRSRPSFRRPPTRETQEEPPSPPPQEGDSVPQRGLLKLEEPPQPSALRPEGTPVPARRRPLGHGFGLAHSGMMQELQARLGQPKPQ